MAYPKLPNKMSDLIEVALKDLTSVRRSSRYSVNMSIWHVPENTERQCHVCLAGAVMARTLGADPEKDADPYVYPERITAKLEALNALRRGDVLEAYCTIRDTTPQSLSNRMYQKCRAVENCLIEMRNNISGMRVTPYSESPKLFVRDMRRLQTLLVDFGL